MITEIVNSCNPLIMQAFIAEMRTFHSHPAQAALTCAAHASVSGTPQGLNTVLCKRRMKPHTTAATTGTAMAVQKSGLCIQPCASSPRAV